MLLNGEIMNNAFKDLLFREEFLAKKYAKLHQEITDPQLQKILQSMEYSCRTRYSMLSEKMNQLGITWRDYE